MQNEIDFITIKNIKGIKTKRIDFNQLVPQKICILVGRNGSGKSSFAKGLSYANNLLELDDSDKNTDTKDEPSIEIDSRINNKKVHLCCNKNSNEISKHYHITLLSNPLKADGKIFSAGGFPKAKGKMITDPITIIKIKKSVNSPYSITKIRESIKPELRKYFKNLEAYLDYDFYDHFLNKFKSIGSLKTIEKEINKFLVYLESISSFTVSKALLKMKEDKIVDTYLRNIKLRNLYDYINKKHLQTTAEENFLIVIQILIWKPDAQEIRDYFNYLRNKKDIEFIQNFLEEFNTTHRELVHKEKDHIVFKCPDVKKISNGERDLLTFAATMLKSYYHLDNSKQGIFIFDEIYDYLDGSNLLAFQYILTKFLDVCREKKLNYYFLLFTHLDPYYFKNFVLSPKTKIINFESKITLIKDKIYEDMLLNREDCINYNEISAYYLHFNPTIEDCVLKESNKYYEISFLDCYPSPMKFINECKNEFIKYLNSENYNIFKVCTFIRIMVEKIIYNKLDENKKEKFVSLRCSKKFSIIEDNDNIPEEIYIAKTFYNEAEHLTNQEIDFKRNTIFLRLNNFAASKILNELFDQYNSIV